MAPIARVLILITMFTALGCGGSTTVYRQADPGEPLAGPWLMEISSADVGYVRTIVDVETSGQGFEAHSREGAASDFLGWFELALAKVFTDYFENGALIHFVDGSMKGRDSITAVFVSALGKMRFDASLRDGRMQGVLKRQGKIRGRIAATRILPPVPLDDYPKLVAETIALAESNFYSRSVASDGRWLSFRSDITEAAALAQDDLDMTFSFFKYASDLPFSHFYLYRTPPDEMKLDDADDEQAVRVIELSPTTAHLVITSFAGETAPIDSAFRQIISRGYQNLIIDLRGNGGGNVSAMRVAEYLTDRPYPGGCFVTRRWFESHTNPPSVEESGRLPVLSEANVSLLFEGIHNQEGLRLEVTPAESTYRGRVFVLTDRFTASACEPLVYGIRQHRLGTVVGERTAGEMLTGERFDVGNGWSVTIPTADYYAADGYRIDQKGVEPDVAVKPADALSHVMTKLIR